MCRTTSIDPDALYHNNGDGTFTDVTSAVLPHTAWFSMGADSADINNDGWPDLLAADMSGTTHFKDKTTMGAMGARLWVTMTEPRQYMRNALYIGTGTGRMMEAAYLAGRGRFRLDLGGEICRLRRRRPR